jgi:hypothetical protein
MESSAQVSCLAVVELSVAAGARVNHSIHPTITAAGLRIYYMMHFIAYLDYDPSAPDADLWRAAVDKAEAQGRSRDGSGLATVNGESLRYSRDRQKFSRRFCVEDVFLLWMTDFTHAYRCWTVTVVEVSHDEIPVDSSVTPILGIYEEDERYEGCSAVVQTKIKGDRTYALHTVELVVIAPPLMYRRYLSAILQHNVTPLFWHQPAPMTA